MQTQILNFFSDLLYNYWQIEIIVFFILVIEILYLPIFLVTILYHMFKGGGAKPNGNILNVARIFTLTGLAGVIFVKSRGLDLFSTALFWQPFLILFFCGGRYLVISFRIKENEEDAFYHKVDKWLENIYMKYIEPLLSSIE